MNRTQPLKGIRVLDLSRLLPGPYATLMMVDMGAEVVKVEGPGQEDYVRFVPPTTGHCGSPFVALNRGKRSLSVNLKTDGGKALIKSLIGDFDVLVEGFRPGVLTRLGLDYKVLAALNPRLIWCSITGYGHESLLRTRAGHDLNYCALSGILGATGPQGGPPQIPGVQIADIGGGSLNAIASILAALFHRERTGEGQFLDISMAEGALAYMPLLMAGPLAGEPSEAPGEHLLAGGQVNYDTYETKDGQALAVGALEPPFWRAFLTAVDRMDLFDAISAEGEDAIDGKQALSALIAQRTRGEWQRFLIDVDACVEPVLSPDEVMHHPLHRSRGMFRSADQGEFGPLAVMMTPLPFSRHDWPEEGEPPTLPGAPALGEDTEAILTEAGLTTEQITALREQGAI